MAGFNTTERIERDGESILRLRRPTSVFVTGCFWFAFFGIFGFILALIGIAFLEQWRDPTWFCLVTLGYCAICGNYLRYLRDRWSLTLIPGVLRVHRPHPVPFWPSMRIVRLSEIVAILRFETTPLSSPLECELHTGERIPLTCCDDTAAIDKVEAWLREKLLVHHPAILWENRPAGIGALITIPRRPRHFPFSEKPPFAFDLGSFHLFSGARTILRCDAKQLWVEERFWRKTEFRYWDLTSIEKLVVELAEEDWGDEKPLFAHLVLQLRDGTTATVFQYGVNNYEEAEMIGWIATLLNRNLTA